MKNLQFLITEENQNPEFLVFSQRFLMCGEKAGLTLVRCEDAALEIQDDARCDNIQESLSNFFQTDTKTVSPFHLKYVYKDN